MKNKYFLKILGLTINFLLIILIIANFSSFVNALEEPSSPDEEWYEKDKEVLIPITESPISNGFGIKYVFDHWERESILSPYSIKTSVIVDKPKTIKAIWRTDYIDLIITIISLISIIAIVAIILKIKMKKIEEGTPIYRSENGTIPYKRILFNELFLKK
jgi:hypothetical protein